MGYKTSKQRDLILDYLRNMHGHISAEQLFNKINEDHKISLATIYRNLGILVDMEEIKKIPLADGFVYDKTCTPHYHFYCEECGTLYDLESQQLELNNTLSMESVIGVINCHELTFNGTCKNCMNKKH